MSQRNCGGVMTVLVIKILAVLIAVMIISMVIDNRRFVVRSYRLRSSRIKKQLKLVFIADLHEKSYGQDNEKLVERIKQLQPDAVIVGGDLIVYGQVNRLCEESLGSGHKADDTGTDWMKHTLSLMKRLAQICPVFFAEGNHELRLEYYEELNPYDARFLEEMEKAGVRMLHNSAVDPVGGNESGVLLQGLELPMKYYKKFKRTRLTEEELRAMIGEPDRSAYTVLVSHIPVYFPTYAQWGADLCLCGHVHGGLMRLPAIGGVMGTRPNLFPRYSCGQYFYSAQTGGEKHLSSMVLTCGLGMHTLPIRIFNPGEISFVELLPADLEQEEGNGTEQNNSGD